MWDKTLIDDACQITNSKAHSGRKIIFYFITFHCPVIFLGWVLLLQVRDSGGKNWEPPHRLTLNPRSKWFFKYISCNILHWLFTSEIPRKTKPPPYSLCSSPLMLLCPIAYVAMHVAEESDKTGLLKMRVGPEKCTMEEALIGPSGHVLVPWVSLIALSRIR